MRAEVTITGTDVSSSLRQPPMNGRVVTSDDELDGFVMLAFPDSCQPDGELRFKVDPALLREAISQVLATRRSFARLSGGAA